MIRLRPAVPQWRSYSQMEEAPVVIQTTSPSRSTSGLAVFGAIMSMLFLTTVYVRIVTDERRR